MSTRILTIEQYKKFLENSTPPQIVDMTQLVQQATAAQVEHGHAFMNYLIDQYLGNPAFTTEFSEDYYSLYESGMVEDFFEKYNDEPYNMSDDLIDALMAELEEGNMNHIPNRPTNEGKKSNEEKLARYKQQLANWDEAHETELAKKRKGSSLKKKERLRKRILALQKKMKREAEGTTEK